MMKVVFEEIQSNIPLISDEIGEIYQCYSFNDIILFTPDSQEKDKEKWISKCWLIHFGFSRLNEIKENQYLENGKKFQMLCFTKSSTYSIVCEVDSEKDAIEWIEILIKSIQKKKEALIQSNVEANLENERSLMRNRVVLRRKDLNEKEFEFYNIRKHLWNLERQIKENTFEISLLEEETNELNEDLKNMKKNLKAINKKLSEIKKEYKDDSCEIEKTDIKFWKYLGRDFDVIFIIFI